MGSCVEKDIQAGTLQANQCQPFTLIIGVICGSIVQIEPLLLDINKLRKLPFLNKVEVVVLANGEDSQKVISLTSQIFIDDSSLAFQVLENQLPGNTLPIGQARSLLQKTVGRKMEAMPSSYAWILDDDMRIPIVASEYLSWLPAFRKKGIDVLIGSFNGGSPNPPAHGIRVQINDLIHNLRWLSKLKPEEKLPDRNQNNAIFRKEYPDYYYDLSRKHQKHLTQSYWVVPEYPKESVASALQRILSGINKIFTGEPFLRPLISELPCNPIDESYPSCNRGGNTFILSSSALISTPNIAMMSGKKENRRSDMIWAIINKYYHGLKIHAVSFPVNHHRYIGTSNSICLTKTVSEIKGAALYAAMLRYFEKSPNSAWFFTNEQIIEITNLYFNYIEERLMAYKENFNAIHTMLEVLGLEFGNTNVEVEQLIDTVRKWVDFNNLNVIKTRLYLPESYDELRIFLNSITEEIKKF